MKFSIIIPLFNEAENIDMLNNELISSILDIQKSQQYNFEIIYVDDGSSDDTLTKLKNLNNSINTVIVKNFKNLSQSKSILNGIEVSSNENIILLDGDLQNDPKDIKKMIELYVKEKDIIVHGFRKFRKDPYLTKILPSKIANYIVRIFTNSKILDHGCSLKIFKKEIIKYEDFFGDFHRLFAAQINKRNKIVEIEVNHRARLKGKSNYGFERFFRVLVDLIFIKFVRSERSYFYTLGIFGLFSFLFSFLTFLYMIFLKLFENKSFIETPLPTLVVFFALSGLIFFSISLMLETIKKMIKENSNKNKDYEKIID
tara:strand:- start:438 stop:1379 length:942 start_codon:yes stop_codon:yes gene_type:complete